MLIHSCKITAVLPSATNIQDIERNAKRKEFCFYFCNILVLFLSGRDSFLKFLWVSHLLLVAQRSLEIMVFVAGHNSAPNKFAVLILKNKKAISRDYHAV